VIYFSDLEDKLLRIWIKYLINRLNTNDRSSNESTSNIQRIAKKSRTSASTNFIHEKQRNTAPLPVYPFIFNPFIHHTIYSTFVPLPHVATTHLIPISQVPYQQEEYHHQILIPIQTQYPYGFSHVPGYMSSTPVNMNTNFKKPVNFYSYITPNNQGEIRKYDKYEETPASMTKIDINNTTPMGLPLEEPVQINPTKDEEIEQINPSKGEESLNVVKKLPKPVIMPNNQTKKFQDTQYLSLHTTGEELDTSTSSDTTIFQEHYSTTLMPMDKLDLSSQPEIFNSKSIQLVPSKNSYYVTDKSIIINQSFSKSSTQEINTWPTTENPKKSTTESETEPENINYSDTKETSIVEERNQSGDPRQVPVSDLSLRDKNETKYISEASTIRTEEKSMETVKSQEPKILIVSSTIAYQKPTLLPTTLYDTNDSQKSKSSINVTESIKTVVQITSNESSIQSKSEFSTTRPTRVNDENYNQSVLNSSTVSQISDTKVSEPTTLTNKISKPLTIAVSTSPFSLGSITSQIPYFQISSNKNNSIQPTSLPYSYSTPAIQPLNFNNTVISVFKDPKTEQTPSVIKNSGDYNIKNLKDIKLSYDKSTILPKTTVTTPSRRESIENTIQNNKSPSVKIITPKISQHIRTTTEIPNILYREDKMNHNFSVTAKETRKNWLTSKTTVKPRISNQKQPLPLVTVSDSLKRKSINNQDRIIAKTEPPQTYDDSQLWYNNQMNTENIPKKELNDAQIDFLLKKLIKLLKPEIEKETLTKDSLARLIAPKLGDQDKLVYIIFPWVRDAANNMENEENTKMNKNPLKHSEKL